MLHFEDEYKLVSTVDREFKNQILTYRYKCTFEYDSFSYSYVYKFAKQSLNHLINLFSDSCKTITLYVVEKNEIKHKIYYLATDMIGNTIKKEKFSEDIDILPPLDIFFQVELINIPLQFNSNTLKKILRPTFKLKLERFPRTLNGTVEKELCFYTERIQNGLETKEEVFNNCIHYLPNFQFLYKKERLNGEIITKSYYEISLYNSRETTVLYWCEINNEGEQLIERKIYEYLDPIIRNPYKILLTIHLIYDPNEIHNMEYDTQTEIEELELRLGNLRRNLESYQNRPKETNKCIKSDTCCICLSNPSNIIFTDCGHLCICEACNEKLTELKCPICRTEITQPRLII